MTPRDRADAYLTIPDAFGLSYGGLTWSRSCDAVIDADGATFVLAEELAAVLEGAFAAGRPPAFGFVLGLLRVMKGGAAREAELGRLHAAYAECKGAVSLARNVGVLVAELCASLPADPVPPWDE